MLARAWPIVAVLGALLLTALGVQTWRLHTAETDLAKQQASYAKAEADAVVKARETERDWQTNVDALTEVHQDEVTRIAAARDAALLGLRNSTRAASRMPAASGASCAGASPASLATSDASVVVGYAAEFDQLRADYATCRAYVETVTHPKVMP